MGSNSDLIGPRKLRAMERGEYPHCCEQSCPFPADFEIYGEPIHPDDVTHACLNHVGTMLGTPAWKERDNEAWTVGQYRAESVTGNPCPAAGRASVEGSVPSTRKCRGYGNACLRLSANRSGSRTMGEVDDDQ